MGIFSTVELDGKQWQTKALPDLLTDNYRVGDEVVPSYKSLTEEEWNLSPRHRYDPAPTDFSFPVIPNGGDDHCERSVLVRGGRIVGFGEHPENRFDYRGHSVGARRWEPVIVADPTWQRSWGEARDAVRNLTRNRTRERR